MENHPVRNKLGIILFSSFLTLNFLFFIIYQVSDYFTGFGFNESVIYHVFYGIQGFDISLYLNQIILFLILISLVTYISFAIPLKYLGHLPYKLFLNLGLITTLWFQPLTNNLFTQFGSTVFNRSFTGNLHPTINSDIIIPSNKNLVFIYAESLEATFMDPLLFPGLTPNLNKLAQKALVFNNINQTYGAASTVSGMVASQCAVPFDSNGIVDHEKPFLPSLYCLSDILSENDYNLSYRGGASLKFAGKGNFYKSHSFNSVKGKTELKLEMSDPDYINKWGLYDDTLFELVGKEFDRLASLKQKFGLFLLTLDTHVPDNFASRQCDGIKYQQGNNDYLNIIHCSDQMIAEFVERINKSEAAKDTIIIIASDHLNPDSKLFLKDGSSIPRKNMLMILGSDEKPSTITKLGSSLDVSPTILSLLGSNTYQHNLGVDLLSDQISLLEEDVDLNYKLIGWTYQLRKFN